MRCYDFIFIMTLFIIFIIPLWIPFVQRMYDSSFYWKQASAYCTGLFYFIHNESARTCSIAASGDRMANNFQFETPHPPQLGNILPVFAWRRRVLRGLLRRAALPWCRPGRGGVRSYVHTGEVSRCVEYMIKKKTPAQIK